MFCANCQNNLNPSDSFCPYCGQKVEKPKKKIPKKYVFLFVLFIGIFLLGLVFLFFFLGQEKKSYGTKSAINELTIVNSKEGIPKFISGSFSNKKVYSSNDALDALGELQDLFHFKDVHKEFVLTSTETYEGLTFYRFQQVYDGVEVNHQNLVISVKEDGTILSLSGYYLPSIQIDIKDVSNVSEIKKIAQDYFKEDSTIKDPVLKLEQNEKGASLIYMVEGFNDEKNGNLVIDAKSKEILRFENFYQFDNYPWKGLGIDGEYETIQLESYFDLGATKTRYRFHDIERDIYLSNYNLIGATLSIFLSMVPIKRAYVVNMEDGELAWYDQTKFTREAVTAMANFSKIYDYYKKVLKRDSYDGKGSRIFINLGVTLKTLSNESLNNAFWAGGIDEMFIGDWDQKSFAVALDVLGHEFTHGVVEHTANFASSPKQEDLNKPFETGALNEAYADILGNLIEGKNWTMGESIEVLRDAEDPSRTKEPSIKEGEYYFPDRYLDNGKYTVEDLLKANNVETLYDIDQGGVHVNSNVVSHAAYLMDSYHAFQNKEEMAQVWYQSLFLLSSYANFHDCALAVLQSAKNLGLSNNSILKIKQAFLDTKMLEENLNEVEFQVKSGEEEVKDYDISIVSNINQEEIHNEKTDNPYKVDLYTGNYTVKVTKNGFQDFETTIDVSGNMKIDISLIHEATLKKEQNEIQKEQGKDFCTTSECVEITWYYLGVENGKDSSQVNRYNKGIVLSGDTVVDAMNESFENLFSFDGESLYMNMAGIKTKFDFYYKGTENKFKWNEPINEDIELEMRISNDFLGNNFDLFGQLKEHLE